MVLYSSGIMGYKERGEKDHMMFYAPTKLIDAEGQNDSDGEKE
ncbi:hypothetical protein LCGC14_0560990 [marine sediment metagenome]|uniref:Uncharacterized protein n=1 Tax=marine sediment metagenome TaxID=412755 RepID=A0A0F9UV82_9ZZZZ